MPKQGRDKSTARHRSLPADIYDAAKPVSAVHGRCELWALVPPAAPAAVCTKRARELPARLEARGARPAVPQVGAKSTAHSRDAAIFPARVSRGVYLDCRIGKSGVFVARDVGVGVGGAVYGCAAANNRRVRGCGCGCGVWAAMLPITAVSVRVSLCTALIVVLLFI